MPDPEQPVVSLVSLGCAKNQVDSERIIASLVQEGFLLAEDPADADIALVNTCAFLESARQETRDVLSELQALKKRSGLRAVVALGCYPSKTGVVPGADALSAFKDYRALPALCRKLLRLPARKARAASPEVLGCGPRLRLGPKEVAYLKISEGCANRCAYCAIPSIRGPLRSRPMADILKEASDLVADGAHELVLVGQDTAGYGLDLKAGKTGLAKLMSGLLGIRGYRWLRLMYAYPSHLSDEVVEYLGQDRVAAYLDLPIQHADDGVLKAMNRPYTGADLKTLIAKLRKKVPEIALRTTCLVGFPGETESAFRNLRDFVQEACFDHLGAFAYSREPGTKAHGLPGQVEEAVKVERLNLLMACQKKASRKAGQARLGKVLEVLVEKAGPRFAVGRSQYQAPEVDGKVLVCGPVSRLKTLQAGMFCRARISSAQDYDLVGRLV
ncbi:MAG: 30S ribosomal protein S12 methylthiotransferase RimO [Elusimicrobia bacterium]|nr:30S ribosomal protein S12 methylthiotransferase RimO [Elusimicrobiota bacterium]